MDYEQEHQNWIRFNCLTQSVRVNSYRSIERIISDAQVMENYVLGRKPAEVVKFPTAVKLAEKSE